MKLFNFVIKKQLFSSKMRQERKIPYVIEIDTNSNYPFNLPKPSKFDVSVKVRVPFQQPHHNFHRKVHLLLSANSSTLVKIREVIESYKQQSYTFVYEYLPFPALHPFPPFQFHLAEKKYENSLKQMFTKLLDNGIYPEPCLEDFGFTQNCQLKFYLRPSFKTVDLNLSEEVKNGMANDLVTRCGYEFQKKRKYQIKGVLKDKISVLEGKIQRIRQNFLKIKARQSVISKSATKKESSSSSQWNKNASVEIKNQRNLSEDNFESSSLRQVKTGRKRTSSFKLLKKKSKSEHKLSWQGTETLSHEESDKATVLKNRVSEALMKTQKTLTKYEKAKKRGKSFKK